MKKKRGYNSKIPIKRVNIINSTTLTITRHTHNTEQKNNEKILCSSYPRNKDQCGAIYQRDRKEKRRVAHQSENYVRYCIQPFSPPPSLVDISTHTDICSLL